MLGVPKDAVRFGYLIATGGVVCFTALLFLLR